MNPELLEFYWTSLADTVTPFTPIITMSGETYRDFDLGAIKYLETKYQ